MPKMTRQTPPDIAWRNLSNDIILRDKRRCRLCTSQNSLTVHHITPRDAGGTDEPRNLITLCNVCHDNVEGKPWRIVSSMLEKQLPDPPDIPKIQRGRFIVQVATKYHLFNVHWGTNGDTGGCWGVDRNGIITFVEALQSET